MMTFLCELPIFFYTTLAGVICFITVKKYLNATMGICKSPNQLDGKTVIVTGASSGIGKETALELAHRGARVILACRNIKKADSVKEMIVKESGNENVVVRELDLASLSSVRKFAAEILKSESRLDVLINNAGCVTLEKTLTEDGLELQMQSNHFGHFLLTNLLLGLLKKSAPSRVINNSSMLHQFACNFDVANLNSEISYNSSQVYYNSKLCQLLFSRYLAPLIMKDGVTINSLHPGAVQSELLRNAPAWFRCIAELAFRFLFKSSEEGAQTSIHLAVADEVATTTGEYFSDCKTASTSKLAKDDGLAKKLWEASEHFVKLTPEERHF